MNKLFLFLLVLLVAPFVSAQTPVCEDLLDLGQNCSMLTPAITCSTYNYTCYTKAGVEAQQGVLTQINGSIYSFTFNQTTEGGYICELCDSSTREIVVVRDEVQMFIFFIFAWLIFTVAIWDGGRWFNYLAGLFFVVLGIFSMTYGVGSTNDWLTRAVAFIHLGVGFLVILVYAWKDLDL